MGLAGPARPVYLMDSDGKIIGSSNPLPTSATGGGTVGGATEVTLADLLSEFRNRYDVVQTAKATYLVAGTEILINVNAATRLRPVWFYAQAAASLGQSVVRVTFALGTNSYEVELTGSQPFMHGAVWEGGLGEDLTVTLSAPAEVLVNVDYRTFV